VYDQKRFAMFKTKRLMVGSVEMDLETVYDMPGHEMHRQWFTLYETDARREGPQGQVLLSIAVLSEGDRPVPHNELIEEDIAEEAADPVTGLLNASTVNGIENELYYFHVKLWRGYELPQVDTSVGKNGVRRRLPSSPLPRYPYPLQASGPGKTLC